MSIGIAKANETHTYKFCTLSTNEGTGHGPFLYGFFLYVISTGVAELSNTSSGRFFGSYPVQKSFTPKMLYEQREPAVAPTCESPLAAAAGFLCSR